MAIICDNDMEIILKGSSEEVIRKMLKDRLFALIKMPAKKPEKYTSEFSSSVFVGFIGSYNRSFAIRPAGAKTVYEACEYYLTMYYKRGTGEEENMYFDRSLKRKEDDQLYIGDISMVKRAIELANKDLLNEYRINVYEDERSLMDSVVPGTEYVYFTLFDMFAPVIYLSRTISELLVARIINNT